MKILILANNIPGLLSFRKELVIALRERGDEVVVSAPDNPRFTELDELGCNVVKTEINRRGINPVKDFALFCHYHKLMRRVNPDVVLGYTIKPNVYGGMAAQMLGLPYIANITGLGTAVEYPGMLQRVTVAMYKAALRKMKCIFFQNEANKAFFEKHNIAPKVKKELLPGSGVNLERFKPEPYPSADTTEFIYISRVMREKGIDEYLYAAEKMKEKYGDKVVFHILGFCEDESYKRILDELSARGIVVYHGQQNDVRPFIARIHCSIHPSFYPEGMSNVLLEAEAMGHPVITTKRPGCRETVEDGVTGFLFDERDKEQCAALVDKFICLPHEVKQKMGMAARKRVEQLFDRRIVVNKYLEQIDH